MKPSLLKRHLEGKHADIQDKDLSFFKQMESVLKRRKKVMTSYTSHNAQTVEASYRASFWIAKAGKSHTIGESLLLPAMKDIVSTVLGEKKLSCWMQFLFLTTLCQGELTIWLQM